MVTYAFCDESGNITSVCRRNVLPNVIEQVMNAPDGGFYIDLTGDGTFNSLDMNDLCNNYIYNGYRLVGKL